MIVEGAKATAWSSSAIDFVWTGSMELEAWAPGLGKIWRQPKTAFLEAWID